MLRAVRSSQILVYCVAQPRARRANEGVLVGGKVDCTVCTVFVLVTRSELETVLHKLSML